MISQFVDLNKKPPFIKADTVTFVWLWFLYFEFFDLDLKSFREIHEKGMD